MPRHQVSDLSQEGTPVDAKFNDPFFETEGGSKTVTFAQAPSMIPKKDSLEDDSKHGGAGYPGEELEE